MARSEIKLVDRNENTVQTFFFFFGGINARVSSTNESASSHREPRGQERTGPTSSSTATGARLPKAAKASPKTPAIPTRKAVVRSNDPIR